MIDTRLLLGFVILAFSSVASADEPKTLKLVQTIPLG